MKNIHFLMDFDGSLDAGDVEGAGLGTEGDAETRGHGDAETRSG